MEKCSEQPIIHYRCRFFSIYYGKIEHILTLHHFMRNIQVEIHLENMHSKR